MANNNRTASNRPGSGGKILVLGARGNLGVQLTKEFSDAYETISWDREEIDITDKELILKKVKDLKPKVIINVAAYNAVDKCENNEDELAIAKKINSDAVGNLTKAALSVGAVLIHYSTDYVFGAHAHHHAKTLKEIKEQGGYLEGDEQHPINKYGQTKLGGESEIIKLSGKGLKWYLIRTSKLFGPKGASEASKPSFFDMMLESGREKGAVDAVNDEKSCFTYTPDLAKATRELLESGKGYGIYHIINGAPRTWYRAARELFKIAGLNVNVNPVTSDKFPRPAKRPKYSVLKNTKLQPLRDYGEALKEYLNQLKIIN